MADNGKEKYMKTQDGNKHATCGHIGNHLTQIPIYNNTYKLIHTQ